MIHNCMSPTSINSAISHLNTHWRAIHTGSQCLLFCYMSAITPQRQQTFSSLHLSRLALGCTQPLVQWVPGLHPWVKQPGHGIDHLPPSSNEVKNEKSYCPTPSYVCTVCYGKTTTFMLAVRFASSYKPKISAINSSGRYVWSLYCSVHFCF